MTDKTFMRVPKKLLEEIKKKKIAEGESYADVVQRMINKDYGLPDVYDIGRGRIAVVQRSKNPNEKEISKVLRKLIKNK